MSYYFGGTDCPTCGATIPDGPCAYCERDSLRAKLQAAEEQGELDRLRLAACSTAAVQNTEASIAERIDRSNPYWSASYGDVCDAVDREMAMRYRAEAAEAEVARLTDCLETQYEINRNTARAACEARGDHFDAEDRIAELEAELLGAMREKEDVRRTATEDALRHIAKTVMGYQDDYVTDHWVNRHLSAVCGEAKS